MTDTDVLDLYLDDVDVGPPGGLLGGMSDDSTSLGLSSALTQDDPLQQSPFNQMPGIAASAQYDFSQFVTPKFHHISDPSLGGSQNLLGQTPPPHSSLSNSDSLLQSANQFNNYNISTGQTITTSQQQQQQDLVSNSVWNPPQTNNCFLQTQQVQNQPTEVQQNVAGTVDLNMSSYLTHHDYALPAAQQPLARLSHFPDNMDTSQTSILQGSIGQTEATQMLNVPIANTSGVDSLGHMQQPQQQHQHPPHPPPPPPPQQTLFTSTTRVPLAAPDITVNTYNSSQALHNFQATDYLETHNPQQVLQQVCNGATMLNSGTNQQSVGTNDAAVNIVQQYTFQTAAASNSPQLQLHQSQPVSGSQPIGYHTGHSVPQYQATYNVSANILASSQKTALPPQQPALQMSQTELGHLTEPSATFKQSFHPQLVASTMNSKPDNRMVIQASVINNQIGNPVQTTPASNITSFVSNGFEGTASASVAESPIVTANAPELPQSVSFIFNTVCNTLGPNQSKCLLVQCPPSTQSTNQLQQQQQSLIPETGTQLCVSSPSTSTYNNVVKLQPQHTFAKGRSFHLIHADLQIPQENQSQTTTTVPLSQLLSSSNLTRLVPQSTAQQTFTNASCQISTAPKQVTQQIHLTTVSPKQQSSGTQPLAKVITSASPAIFTSTRTIQVSGDKLVPSSLKPGTEITVAQPPTSLSTSMDLQASKKFMITTATSGGTVQVGHVTRAPKSKNQAKVVSLTIKPPCKTTTSNPTILVKTDKKKRTTPKKKKVYKTPQDKADEIIAQALVDAQQKGITEIPRVIPPSGVMTENIEKPAVEKPKRVRKPKEPKELIESKEKRPKASKKRRSPAKKVKPIPIKRNKKRGIDSDNSDMEMTPPQISLEDDSIQKRRSARNTKRKKYCDDVDLNFSDDNQEIDVESVDIPMFRLPDAPLGEEVLIVEKILGFRMEPVPLPNSDETTLEEQFYVKYKNLSYLHCEWKSVENLSSDLRIQGKVKRFKAKYALNQFLLPDDGLLFNPAYIEVDRVLDMAVDADGNVTHYFVKWCSLPYEDSTWELPSDVSEEKIEELERFRKIPTEEHKERPQPSEWKKLKESREYKNNNVLREYQLEGVNWLMFSWHNGRNCILADEMGLGKTIQSITYFYEIKLQGIHGPFLVIAPLSTVCNWQREFENWTDMNAIIYHGGNDSRHIIRETEFYFRDENNEIIPGMYKFNALITTFEMIISDCDVLSNIDWRCVAIDEAHRLKNRHCRLIEYLKKFDVEHIFLLTGTPLQNNIEELFSLLNFLNPRQFDSFTAFMKDFGDLKTEEQVDQLKSLLKPVMLRRLKEDVEKNIAPKEETIVEVELTNIQKKYYRAILENNFEFLSKGTTNSNFPNLMNTMMELRKCCNHLYLIKGAEEKILAENAREPVMATPFESLVKSSGKLVLLDKLLPKLKQGGHKVLIFSQMIKVLDIIEDYLLIKKYTYERLDGRIRGNLRQEAIDRFSKPDSDRFIFLLCTRAGGLGINLTAADTVVIYDSDWNPQNDLQAQARCHRIGQNKSVKVYRLITRNTYEREMFDKASLKLGLDKALLQSAGADKKVGAPQRGPLTKKEIEDLLKRGAYGTLMYDDKAGDKFCEEDIEEILQGRTSVVQLESAGTGSTFAKASFSMKDNCNIEVNDPDFWAKWAKKAEIDQTKISTKKNLIIEEPRQRRQTARYGNQDLFKVSDIDSDSDYEESEGEEKKVASTGKKRGRKKGSGRRKLFDEDYEIDEPLDGSYARAELFKVEKNLLVYGWGRWADIISHGRFKRRFIENDVETISRAMLLYSLKFYKGDERIKDFIWDLVSPSSDCTLKNHSGLSAPVPRGRKGKKAKRESKNFSAVIELEKSNMQMDLEAVLCDQSYKRHIERHSNKVLLRVRLLYYLKQEVIGDECQKVLQGADHKDINIPKPIVDGEPPCEWWDEDADKCLLIGIFKHGYEKYSLIQQDPRLCFFCKCGPPDGDALLAEQNDDNDNDYDIDVQASRDEEEDVMEAPSYTRLLVNRTHNEGKLPFPGISELNTRFRRMITGYQRNHCKTQQILAQRAKKLERLSRAEAANKERAIKKRESQQRWSRRENADFYKTISSYGVEINPKTKMYKWDHFRILARLDKKYDDTLTEYYEAFYDMCQRTCKKEEEITWLSPQPNSLFVEPITSERACRCLSRISLLRRLRENIIPHPQFENRIKLCQMTYDMPSWWVVGNHDKELVLGAAKHGISRMDLNICPDQAFSFHFHFKDKINQSSLFKPLRCESTSLKGDDSDSKDSVLPGKAGGTSESDSEFKFSKVAMKHIGSDSCDEKLDDGDDTLSLGMKIKSIKSKEKSNYLSDTEDDITKSEIDDKEKLSDADIKMEDEEEFDSKLVLDSIDRDLYIKDANRKLSIKDEDADDEEEDDDKSITKMDTEERAAMNVFKINPDEIIQNSVQASDDIDMDVDYPVHANDVYWPKDKILFQRLEHICYTIETGEWPQIKKLFLAQTSDSCSTTPLDRSTPKPELSDIESGESSFMEISKKTKPVAEYTSEVEGMKVKISKNKICLPKNEESSANKALSFPQFNHSAFSSDNESVTEAMNLSTSMVDSLNLKKKRGRKRKSDMLSSNLHEKMAKKMLLIQNNDNPDERVSMVHEKEGIILSGDEAPMKKDLLQWMQKNPEYKPFIGLTDEDFEPEIEKRRRRRPRLDPSKLDYEALTGDENVSVLNRENGKKITGAKAPPLKYLREWLEKNPCFDVDPKWTDLVRAKGNLPENLKSRLLTSRRHRIRDTLRHHSAYGDATSMAAAAAAAAQLNAFHYANPALLTNFQKMTFPLPFGTMPNLGMGNPLFSVPGLNLRNLASAAGTNLSVASLMEAVKDASDSGSDRKITSSTCTSSSSSSSTTTSSSSSTTITSSSTTTPHPSFPVLYNPIIYNTLLAANNFNIPAAVVPSLTSLAKGDMSNGLADINDSDSDDRATRTLASTTAVTTTTNTSSTTVLKKPSTAVTAATKASTSSMVAAASADNGSDNSNMEAEDLRIKRGAEVRESPSSKKGKSEVSLHPKLIIKTKPKIQQSSKLSRIVDSLKDKVKNLDPLRAKKEYSQEKRAKEIIDSTHSGNSKRSIITTTTSNTSSGSSSSSSSSSNMQPDNREPEKSDKTKKS